MSPVSRRYDDQQPPGVPESANELPARDEIFGVTVTRPLGFNGAEQLIDGLATRRIRRVGRKHRGVDGPADALEIFLASVADGGERADKGGRRFARSSRATALLAELLEASEPGGGP